MPRVADQQSAAGRAVLDCVHVDLLIIATLMVVIILRSIERILAPAHRLPRVALHLVHVLLYQLLL